MREQRAEAEQGQARLAAACSRRDRRPSCPLALRAMATPSRATAHQHAVLPPNLFVEYAKEPRPAGATCAPPRQESRNVPPVFFHPLRVAEKLVSYEGSCAGEFRRAAEPEILLCRPLCVEIYHCLFLFCWSTWSRTLSQMVSFNSFPDGCWVSISSVATVHCMSQVLAHFASRANCANVLIVRASCRDLRLVESWSLPDPFNVTQA